jgi:hypothetical protein
MKTRISNTKWISGAAILMIVALVAAAVDPVLGQTRRKPRLRKTSRTTRKVQPVPTPDPVYYSVNAGQLIRVQLNQTITSETARVGDQFSTTVVNPIYGGGGVELVPVGSIIVGHVTTVERAGRKSKPGTIGVQFVSLRLPSGITRAINGDLTDATSNDVNADNEGQVSGRSATKRNLVFIGGGAATGALIGAIAGGGKGAGIGAGIGAGLGVAGALFAKGHEAVVKSGTKFGVILNQSISLPATTTRTAR